MGLACFTGKDAAALALLVSALPASAALMIAPETADSVPSRLVAPAEKHLTTSSAADLIGAPAPKFDASWTVREPVIRPVQRDIMEPKITSVPVAALVGGVLIASLGITQQLRRARDSRI